MHALTTAQIRDNNKAENTKLTYIRAWRRFVTWITENKPDLLNPNDTEDLYSKILLPLSDEIIDLYLAVISFYPDGRSKSISTIDQFWATVKLANEKYRGPGFIQGQKITLSVDAAKNYKDYKGGFKRKRASDKQLAPTFTYEGDPICL